MSISTLQAQLKQLRTQLKTSDSPEQSSILAGTIAHLEEKLLEAQETSKTPTPKLEIITSAKPKTSKRVTAQTTPLEKQSSPLTEESAPTPPKETAPSNSPRQQILKSGKTLKAAPGQGQHQLIWRVKGTLETEADYLTFTPENSTVKIPLSIYKSRRKALLAELPTSRYCSIYPIIKNGIIVKGQLANWKQLEGEEKISAQGFWIPDEQKLLIQSDFTLWKEHSRNRYHELPLADGIECFKHGFKAFQITRDGLKFRITGETEILDLQNPTQGSKTS